MNLAATQPASDNLAAMLAMAESGELVTTLTPAQLRALSRQLDSAITIGEAALDHTRHHAGVAATLHFGIGLGTGYLRHCRDIIRALLKARKK